MPTPTPIVSLGDLVRIVREEKAQAPRDSAVDAALRKRVADTGNAFWMDVAERILQEVPASAGDPAPVAAPNPAIEKAEPTTTATPATPPAHSSWYAKAAEVIGDWVAKYLGARLPVALLSAVAAIGVWRAASGPPARTQNADTVSRTEVVNELQSVQDKVRAEAGKKEVISVNRVEELLKDAQDKFPKP